MCSPGRKGRADLTSSPPSSHLTAAVSAECPALPDGNCGEGLRSLWHLSRHLTARADDNHAAPSLRPRRASPSLDLSSAIQARVRFLAYHRIKPHVPPLVRAPVNSFEFHRCRRTPQVGCLTLSLGRATIKPHSGHPSFTVRTTRVSNPVRYPHLRASASVKAIAGCLRNRGSSSYLSISPLHDEFRRLTAYSSPPVRAAGPALSADISQHA